jgi:hypothetical protein
MPAMEDPSLATGPGPASRALRRGGAQVIPWPVEYRSGDRSPWAHLPSADRLVDLAGLRRAFAERRHGQPVREPFAVRRPAAVLVPLYEGADGLRVVLTRRPTAMRSHSGEVSFPGGGREPEDVDLVATALRESEEEIGLDPARVEVIGQLDPLATLSSAAMITPYVGVIADLPPSSTSPWPSCWRTASSTRSGGPCPPTWWRKAATRGGPCSSTSSPGTRSGGRRPAC